MILFSTIFIYLFYLFFFKLLFFTLLIDNNSRILKVILIQFINLIDIRKDKTFEKKSKQKAVKSERFLR